MSEKGRGKQKSAIGLPGESLASYDSLPAKCPRNVRAVAQGRFSEQRKPATLLRGTTPCLLRVSARATRALAVRWP